MAPESWAHVPLHGVREIDNARYVERNGSLVRCHLCDTGWMTSEESKTKHFTGGRHEHAYGKLVRLKQRRRDKRRSGGGGGGGGGREDRAILPPSAQAMTDSFRMSKRSEWARSLDDRTEGLGLERWRWHIDHLRYAFVVRNDVTCKARAEWSLARYEKMDKVSSLELALWKMSIACHATANGESCEDESERARFRFISGSSFIIPQVLAFMVL